MSARASSDVALSPEAREIVWRVFGAGESLLTNLSTYDLIEPIVSRHLAQENRHQAIDEIRGWFVLDGNTRRIKPDIIEKIAVIIVEGIDSEQSDLAPWSIAWIDSEISGKILSSRWCDVRIKSFVGSVLGILERLCSQDRVLDPVRSARLADVEVNGILPRGSFDRDGKVQTFDELYAYNSNLVHFGIHENARNLMELIIDVEPDCFPSMIARLDHRVVQAWAADYISVRVGQTGYGRPLEWIAMDSCEELIALAIVHTLSMVERLDRDRHYAERLGKAVQGWSTESSQPADELDHTATDLVNGLAGRLGALNGINCFRWVGELLSRAPNMLDGQGEQGKPRRVVQLERAFTDLLARVAIDAWSEDQLDALITGLRLNTRDTWPRHIVDVARAIGDSDRPLANEMFRVALEQSEQQVAEQLAEGRFFEHWSDWHYREWINGLGVSLAFSCDNIDLVKWVEDRCRALPLSVWDAETDGARFFSANPVAQFWFLVAFHAIAQRGEVGRPVDPPEVRALAELLWRHCNFAGRYLNEHANGDVENSVAAEYAARCVIEYGEPSGRWLFDHAGRGEAGPRPLWAIMCQRSRKREREQQTDADCDAKIIKEFVRVASVRFGNGSRWDLEDLKYWGDLWILLETIEEAERTAKAILAVVPKDREFRRVVGRIYEITALKLLALVASSDKLSPGMKDVVRCLHKDLWPDPYIPEEERSDRRQIDEWLNRPAASV